MLDKAFKRFLGSINNGTLPPALQKTVWKVWYQVLARRWQDGAWTFMNYGWMPPEGTPPFPLDTADEPDRAFIGQYHRMASALSLEGLRVLEVGSGRGGGASYVARAFRPVAMVGVDFSPAAVSFSRRIHGGVGNLSFQTGDAESLPFPDASFDAVLNVESSHCYGDMAAFVAEVARVLRPGGRFGWADLRGPGMMAATEDAFAATPALHLIAEDDITDDVVRALDAAHDRKMAAIGQMRMGQALLKQFSATRGTSLYQSLKKRQTRYLARTYEKQ